MAEKPVYLFITAHDMRTARKANVHFIAKELGSRGKTRLFSLGFSWLSKIRGRDPRIGLEELANKPQEHDGVETYLWWTPLHPGNLRLKFLEKLNSVLFKLYSSSTPHIFEQWVKESDVILIESGIGVILIDRIKKIKPTAELLYIASDDMNTINVAEYVIKYFSNHGKTLDRAIIPSKLLADIIPAGPDIVYVPHGISKEIREYISETPYKTGVNAVSVGSMLFDKTFFEMAVKLFPDIKFHVIGAGVSPPELPSEVIFYPEMPFIETIRFIKYADFGVAPYKDANVPYYLADTSMKLMQYDYFSLPSVCPAFARNESHALRFAYTPGDATSIESAIRSAMACPKGGRTHVLNWSDVVDRILCPGAYSDTRLQA